MKGVRTAGNLAMNGSIKTGIKRMMNLISGFIDEADTLSVPTCYLCTTNKHKTFSNLIFYDG